MQASRNIQQKIKDGVKPLVETWRAIKQLPDPILVIIFIVVLGFGGWYEYNGGKDVFKVILPKSNSKNYDPIALKSLRYLAESKRFYSHEENDEVNAVAFAPDSHTLASGGDKGKIKFWNVGNDHDLVNADKNPSPDQEVTVGNDQEYPLISSIAFSPDGKTLAASTFSGLIQLWQLSESENAESTNAESFCDSKISANSAKWKLCKNLKNSETNAAYSLAFRSNSHNPNDDTLLAIGNEDGTIRLWNINKRKTWSTNDNTINDPNKNKDYDAVFSVAFSQDGKTLASGSADGTVKLWKVSGDQLSLKTTLQHSSDSGVGVVAIKFYTSTISEYTDTEKLASVSGDGTIKLWDMDRLNQAKPIQSFKSRNGTVALTVSSDGKVLATSSNDGTIELWNPWNGKRVRRLNSHPYAVYSLAFSPDGYFLASGSMDETIKVWEIEKRVYLGWERSLPMWMIF